MESRMPLPHSLTLKERESLTMTGVTEVLCFDENTVQLRTDLGILQIQGHNLQLKALSQEVGSMVVEGRVTALSYEEPRQGGWLRRLIG